MSDFPADAQPQGGVFSLEISFFGALVTFLIGLLISCVNYFLMRKSSSSGGIASFLPLLRVFISGAYLAAVFLLAPLIPCDPVWLLTGAALGLTIPMFFFTFLLLRQIKAGSRHKTDDETNSDKGGDV